jgi:hypothetical protein
MSHFAEVDANGLVLRVIVAEQNFINSGLLDSSKPVDIELETATEEANGQKLLLNGTDSDLLNAGDSLIFETNWIKTSYNTRAGIHINSGTPLRKNYASTGGTYDRERDAFIPPKLYPSWILDEDTCNWASPITMPDDGKYYGWDEDVYDGDNTKGWVEMP